MAASCVILLLPSLKWAISTNYGPHTGPAAHLSSKQGWMAPSSSSGLSCPFFMLWSLESLTLLATPLAVWQSPGILLRIIFSMHTIIHRTTNEANYEVRSNPLRLRSLQPDSFIQPFSESGIMKSIRFPLIKLNSHSALLYYFLGCLGWSLTNLQLFCCIFKSLYF